MVITKLIGGLGNQMFQYAFGRALSLKYNTNLNIDKSFLDGSQAGCVRRDYGLDCFTLTPVFHSGSTGCSAINETRFDYSPEVIANIDNQIKNNNNIHISGYWQSPLYFKDFESDIKNDFKFKKPLDNNFDFTESCSVHFRRTDYVNNSHHPLLDISYFERAIGLINPAGHIFVFSDDITWCKENLNFKNQIFAEGNSMHEDLQIMSNCSHNVISNSSFSWWAAYLNKNKNKKVIAPHRWFGHNSDTSTLIPEDWLRI